MEKYYFFEISAIRAVYMLRLEHVARSAGSMGLCSACSHAPAAHLIRVWGRSRTSGKRIAGLMNMLRKLLHG